MDLGWLESHSDEVLRLHERLIPAVEDFIAQAERLSETVLIFCSNGQNRALSIVIALLMRRYYWSFYKTLEFLDSKRANLEIKKNYFKNLKILSEEFEAKHKVSQGWDYEIFSSPQFHEEEMIITNTFLNSKKRAIQLRSRSQSSKRPMQNQSFRNISNVPLSRRSVNGSVKTETTKRVIWADQYAPIVRRSVKSVGKSKLKTNGSDLSFRPPSADGKRNTRPLFIKTEIEETELSDERTPIGLKAGKKILESGVEIDNFLLNLAQKDNKETDILQRKGKLMDNGSGTKQKALKGPKSGKMENNKNFKIDIDEEEFSEEPKFILRSQMEIGSDPNNALFTDVRASNTSEDFYKKGLKDLHKRIFSKTSDPVISDSSKQKNSYSKVSTHVQEDSVKQVYDDSETYGLPSNLSFMQNANSALPEIKPKATTDQKASLLQTVSNTYNFKAKLNKTSEPLDKPNFISKALQPPSYQHLNVDESSQPLSQISKIKIQKRKALEAFFKPQDADNAHQDKKLELLNKLKLLSSEKLVKISSSNYNKDRVSVKSINPDTKNTIAARNEERISISKLKRPNSAPSKDEQKDKMIQKQLLFCSKNPTTAVSKGVSCINQPIHLFVSKVQGMIPPENRPNQPINKCKFEKF